MKNINFFVLNLYLNPIVCNRFTIDFLEFSKYTIKSYASKYSFTLLFPNVYIFNLFLLFNYTSQDFQCIAGSCLGGIFVSAFTVMRLIFL